MLVLNEMGLYCPAGNFYIDPLKRVEHAVITHAHADHARKGNKHYYCTTSGLSLLKARLGQNISVTDHPYRQPFFINDVEITYYPAGHILGSSQVRLKYKNETWVISGDYKREPDPSCEPFESVPCDVFVTEATFGTPAFCWPKDQNIAEQILSWWNDNKKRGRNSVIVAYSLGKTQRLLSMLYGLTQEPIYCDITSKEINECYRQAGILLADSQCLGSTKIEDIQLGSLFIVSQSFFKSSRLPWVGSHYQTAFASGWMNKNHYGFDKGFLLSDHADWNDLITTIKQSQAKKVYIQHRGNGALVKHINSLGIEAYPDMALAYRQLSLF